LAVPDAHPESTFPRTTDPAGSSAVTSWPHALGWAAYLGASWTWVIGMFLPVLLIRDFGPAAWFIFAIPNVLGAAAMGWVIRSRDHSLQLVVRHRVATQTFSLVTIAFHFYVMLWLVPQLTGKAFASLMFGVALLVLIPLFVTRLAQTTFAIAALLVSCIIMTTLGGAGALRWPALANGSPIDLFGLFSVCILGFLTCPYLDLTFHRARQEARNAGESRIAFGVGFGLFFCAMIVCTLFYAWVLITRQASQGVGFLIGVHLCVQAIFTIGIHASALRASVDRPRGHLRLTRSLWVATIGPVVLALLAHLLEARGLGVGRYVAGEVGYRLFMSFYGLLAPAYVWLCLHPGRGFLEPYRRELQMFVVAVVLAAPFFWLGFVHGPMSWTLICVGIILCARFFLDYTRRDFLAEHRAELLSSRRV
jgi:hypothetical protein